MWIYANPNPAEEHASDCVVRAICIALNMPWLQVYDELCMTGRREFDMPSADKIWGRYLYMKGFEPFVLPHVCPRCITVSEFTYVFPDGIYIIGTGNHAVAVVDGNYYDTWDSGNMTATFFWRIAN